ncbi:MerR family transcriptional regulator [Desulfosediminicola ganghwensis]|uniref:MerR family transcriptional regulator n=1 Tax=Desulfosediminicola ganghwensis TaxID=2569540 RepID=UPI0010ACE4F2|nr:MerR family transcriptional regulator [Desulfosediminicola ganghwensis]
MVAEKKRNRAVKNEPEPIRNDEPIYPIGVASKLLGVHPRTLRIYEDEGLIQPHRQGQRRIFSANDLQWITCLRSAIHDQGISIPGVKKLLRFATCYEIVECADHIACNCDAVVDRVIPRKLRLVGNRLTETEIGAKEREERDKLRKEKGSRKSSKIE